MLPPTTKPCFLLEVPTKIRLMIYSEVVESTVDQEYAYNSEDGSTLLTTCRQICSEALPCFQQSLQTRLRLLEKELEASKKQQKYVVGTEARFNNQTALLHLVINNIAIEGAPHGMEVD
jgi:hypothetical protein